MNVSTAERIRELTDEDVKKLTHLFHIKPEQNFDEAWFAEQENAIRKLPSKLLKPKNPFSRLGLKLHIGFQQSILCKVHKPLNPRLIRRIWLQVCNEFTVRNERLSQWSCPQRVGAWLKRIDKINGLWMSPDVYRATYQVQPHEERFDKVEGGCEVCILSRIGGNFQILLDLEVSAWSRRKRGASEPRILRFTDAWFDWYRRDDEVRELNQGFGREIRGVRRACLDERRRNRAEREASRANEAAPNTRAESAQTSVQCSLERDYSAAKFTSPQVFPAKPVFPVMKDHPFAGIFPPRGEDDEDEEQEDESAVQSFYENRMSQAMVSNQSALPTRGLHGAFRRQTIASDEILNPHNYNLMKRTNTTGGRNGTEAQAAPQGPTLSPLGRSSSAKDTLSTRFPPHQRGHTVPSAYSTSVYSQATNAQPTSEAPGTYSGGAYDTKSPYVAPLRVPPKTPAQKPTRTERGPPTATKANKFFQRNENQKEAALQNHLEKGDNASIWTDDTAHTADFVRTERPQQSPRRRASQDSRANLTSEDNARAYRDLLAEREKSYQALVGEEKPTSSPPNRRGPRSPSPDKMSTYTN